MSSPRARVCVLASGAGSNLGALFDEADRLGEHRASEIALVVSNRPSAGALARARERGVETGLIAADGGGDTLQDLLADRRIELVVLAGYLRLVPPSVTRAYRGRLVNVHPALLPAFGGPGMFGRRVHSAVLDAGVRITGATVHFVDEQYDRGPIIAQWPVPVIDGDTADTLAARVLKAEHALLPRIVEAVASRRIRLGDDGRVRGAHAFSPNEDPGFRFVSHLGWQGVGVDSLLPDSLPRTA